MFSCDNESVPFRNRQTPQAEMKLSVFSFYSFQCGGWCKLNAGAVNAVGVHFRDHTLAGQMAVVVVGSKRNDVTINMCSNGPMTAMVYRWKKLKNVRCFMFRVTAGLRVVFLRHQASAWTSNPGGNPLVGTRYPEYPIGRACAELVCGWPTECTVEPSFWAIPYRANPPRQRLLLRVQSHDTSDWWLYTRLYNALAPDSYREDCSTDSSDEETDDSQEQRVPGSLYAREAELAKAAKDFRLRDLSRIEYAHALTCAPDRIREALAAARCTLKFRPSPRSLVRVF